MLLIPGKRILMLSICIPTYNRASRLQLCLQSIEAASIGIDQSFEVLVSNNASTDNTSEILRNWSFKNPRISFKVVSNQSNLGAYYNITRIIEQAAGSKLFWLTDDDLLLPWGLKVVFESIDNSDFDFTKFALISYLEMSKTAYVYGGNSDLDTQNLDMRNLLEIYTLSHVLTGTLVSKNVSRIIFNESKPNIYPSVVWAISSADNAKYVCNPVAIHIGENQIHWELDMDTSTQMSIQKRLDTDFQLSLINSPAPFKSFSNPKILPRYLVKNFGYIHEDLNFEFSYFNKFDRFYFLLFHYFIMFRKSLRILIRKLFS